MSMKIWINAPFSDDNSKLIQQAANGCEVFFGNKPIPNAEIIVGQPSDETDFTRLRLMQSTNAGVEKLISAGIPENVIITNVTGAFGEVIAEYILAGVLSLSRGLFSYRDNQRRHIWQAVQGERMLYEKNALILGSGDIGSATARRLKSLGMNVTGIRRKPQETEFFDSVFGLEALDGLLPQADVIICCLPHTPQTSGLLDRSRLCRVNRGAIIVNVGRGSLIDEAALTEMLESGRIFGAVLDVFEIEPLSEESPLWDMENVLITPHISGPSFGHFPEVERKIAEICAENIRRFLCNEPLMNVIDRQKGYADKSNNSFRNG